MGFYRLGFLFDIQVFEGYYAKTVYNFTASLIDGIGSAVSNPLIDDLHHP